MLALAVSLCLAAEPLVDPAADVDSLSLEQLQLEDARLAHPPSLQAPAVMVSLGLLVAVAGYWTMAFAIRDLASPTAGRAFGTFGSIAPGVCAVFGGIHATFGVGTALGGVFWAPQRAVENEENEVRRTRVRLRLAQLGAADLPLSGGASFARRELLTEARPTLALPAQLLVAGIILLTVGVVSSATLHTDRSEIAAGATELTVGASLVGVSIWQLIVRSAERQTIDDELSGLR